MNRQWSTAIAWLIHFNDWEADAAFARLQHEASSAGEVFRVRHAPVGLPEAERNNADTLHIYDSDLGVSLPTRLRQMQTLGRTFNQGFVDLIWLEVVRKLPGFDFYWLIEYDVDFAAPWLTFFSEFSECNADLLGTNLYPKSQSQTWSHWEWFSCPKNVSQHQMTRGFFPIARLSSRFIETYRRNLDGWSGHFEALFPSIALHERLRLEDIGGDGPMTPPHRRGRLYIGTRSPELNAGTFRFSPPVANHYFPQLDELIPENHLCHPVKTEMYSIMASLDLSGCIESLDGELEINGWLADRLAAAPRWASIGIDGIEIGVIQADGVRPDLAAAGFHQGAHAFKIPLPKELQDGKRHRVELLDRATGSLVHSKSIAFPLFLPGAGRLSGHIDNQGNEAEIVGWIAATENETPRTAVIVIDGQEAARVIASRFRRDLKDAGYHQGNHAFSISVPTTCRDGAVHLVELVDEASSFSVARREVTFESSHPGFVDLDGFLVASLTDPSINAPFDDAKKQVLATMEGISKFLAKRGLAVEATPLVSVVMPAYNRADLIGTAIDSLLRQSYGKFELLVVDDGSSDATVDVVRRISDSRIHLFEFPTNCGTSEARNAALTKATGSLVAYLDTDNTVPRDFLAIIVGAFAHLPDADAIYGVQQIFSGSEQQLTSARFGVLNRALLQNRNYIDIGVLAHRKEVIEHVGMFDPSLRALEDWDFVQRIVEEVKVYSVPALLSNYHEGLAANTVSRSSALHHYLPEVVRKSEGRQAARQNCRGRLSRPVAVVIPNFEAADDLQSCINSIERNYDPRDVKLIIVDNGSQSPESKSLLAHLSTSARVKLHVNPENLGFTFAVNQGARLADDGADLLLLNNDAILTAAALGELQRVAYSDTSIGLTVPQQVLPGSTATISNHVPGADASRPVDVNLSRHHRNVPSVPCFHDGGPLDVTFAPFFCVYIKRDVFQEIGGLDAEFGRHYRSDRIFCDMARKVLGKRIVYVPAAVVFHRLQIATNYLRDNAPADFDSIFTRNAWPDDLGDRLGFRTAAWDR